MKSSLAQLPGCFRWVSALWRAVTMASSICSLCKLVWVQCGWETGNKVSSDQFFKLFFTVGFISSYPVMWREYKEILILERSSRLYIARTISFFC